MKITRKSSLRYVYAFIMIVVQSFSAFAQVTATKTIERPVIDGVIEGLWEKGTRFNSFKQIEPEILADATKKTEGYFMYDNENIYMAMKLYQDKATIHSSKGRRDADLVKDGDWVTFLIDPVNTANTAYFFTVNPENAVRDGTFDEYGTESTQWDAIFHSATAITDEYWSVEIQIPLSSISFQNKTNQDWGIRLYRHYPQNQELVVSKLIDVNSPYRLRNLERLEGLSELNKNSNILITPYVYSHNEADFLQHSSVLQGKTGGEVRYTPNSSMIILATVNPDYAQIETDKEIINVSDLPTEYPEKRPFFTESSDFYTNAAVNTRNIVDIKAGLKIRQLSDLTKYDLTSVLDGNNHFWLFGHLIAGDNKSYLTELTSGLKSQPSRNDYNITTHLQKWFFDKRLSLSNWVGTINNREENHNEWETVNGIRWLTRTFNAVFWSHYKTKMYNPNIVGWNYLSNEVHAILRVQYSLINGSGLFRTTSLQATYDYFDLTSPRGQWYSTAALTFDNALHLSDELGNWQVCLVYNPSTNQKFRFRNFNSDNSGEVFEDAFSKFILVEDKAAAYTVDIRSDNSKDVGFSVSYNNNHVRKSSADNFTSEVFWKIGPDAMVKYSLSYIDIAGSMYQSQYRRTINRFQLEYNLTEKLNIRVIIQPDVARFPGNNDYLNDIIANNVTISWEYLP
ncbi:MAG: carbohydrate binding family 9 domain-containing protein, partial [Ignavibacteriales bacterium]|nr:carbohydrate binding family 9 domain-containing protein [Ignavibacteriales bacterium]